VATVVLRNSTAFFDPRHERSAMNISRRLARASMCVLICLGSIAYHDTASEGSAPADAGGADEGPITLALDVSSPGRAFEGIGGNFRMQNTVSDPPIIEYNLENLRVAWGRVAMPWNTWHPDENTDPRRGRQGRTAA
jgi:hypothetical protein